MSDSSNNSTSGGDIPFSEFTASVRNKKENALSSNVLWFSTEDKAKEYIKWNKPLFSLNEIFNEKARNGFSGDSLIEHLVKLAEQKIKNV